MSIGVPSEYWTCQQVGDSVTWEVYNGSGKPLLTVWDKPGTDALSTIRKMVDCVNACTHIAADNGYMKGQEAGELARIKAIAQSVVNRSDKAFTA